MQIKNEVNTIEKNKIKKPMNNSLKILLTLVIPMIVVLAKPMGMTFDQSMVLGSLFLVIQWWGTGVVHKNIASIFLIIMFILFGNTPIQKVFFFPLSDNMILVVASYLLSQGIVNSRVADKFANFVLKKYCNSGIKLVVMSFLLGVLFIFIIPQPFPRVIILSSIYMNFLKNSGMGIDDRKVIVFSVFVASSVTSLMFLNGDVIINNAVQGFGGISLTFGDWFTRMTLPTLLTTVIIMVAFIFAFRNNLAYKVDRDEKLKLEKMGPMEKKALSITALIVALWLTESIHGMGAAHVALLGVFLMLIAKIIGFEDLKTVNLSLLVFLTAEFAIGKVLVGSGVADRLSSFIVQFFPAAGSSMYVPFIMVLVMVLHMIMGSLITALSVTIPTLIAITAGHLPAEFIVLLVTVSVCFHYVMPFQHVTIMIGYGNDLYDNSHVLKMGLYLTVITILSVMLIYIPWWKVVGVI